MKKLMTIAAVALTGAVFAQGIESANIVGYQTPAVKPNVSLAVDSFVPVSGTVVNINNMKVSGEGVAAGQIQLQTMTSGAATDRTFLWIPTAEAGDYDMVAEGWFDMDNWAPSTEDTFDSGAGFLLMNDFGEGATITYSGAVAQGATEIPVSANVSLCGNCTPVEIAINAMVVSAEGLAAGQIQLQTMTSGAATDRTFLWIPTAEAGDYDMAAEGWFDMDNWVPAEGVSFAPGEGFLLMNDFGEGAAITLPSPLE